MNGTDGEGRGNGTREAEVCWFIGKLRPSRKSRELGIGGGGIHSIVGVIADEFDVDGSASSVVESGWDSAIGAKFPSCKGASGEVVRTKGSGETIPKN